MKTYKANLKLNDQEYSSSGKTPEEALMALEFPQPKTKGIFTFEKDGKESKPAFLDIRQMAFLNVRGLSGDIKRANLIKRML